MSAQTHPLQCFSCGYDLTGLPADAPCPECSTTAEESRRRGRLCFADPAYIRKLSRGSGIVLWSCYSICVLSIFFGACVLIARGELSEGGTFSIVLLGYSLLIAWSVGWWILASTDPRHSAGLGRTWPMLLVRIAAVCVAIGSILAIFSLAAAVFSDAPGFFIFVSLFTLLACYALVIASSLHAISLSRRLPDNKARARARVLLWVIFVPLIILLGVVVSSFFGLVAFITFAALPVFVIRFSHALHKAIRAELDVALEAGNAEHPP